MIKLYDILRDNFPLKLLNEHSMLDKIQAGDQLHEETSTGGINAKSNNFQSLINHPAKNTMKFDPDQR